MWCNILKIKRLIKTLLDIGLKRICQRLKYEILIFFDSIIADYWKIINKESQIKPIWKKTLLNLNASSNIIFKNSENFPAFKEIEFTFLNITNTLNYPIQWNNKKWPRLWQFNLNYFDWSRNWIDKFLKNNETDENLYFLGDLIDQWIQSNKIGFGDSWHSYTTSLRIRNWIWMFRVFPELKNSIRLKSLWTQLCWLYKHPEICHGGNHWLENLTSQIIVSLQFENNYAEIIYKSSIKQLKKELNSQILLDGGHEERSAAYHILILDRLVEVGWVIQIVNNERPLWLIDAIQKMTKWLCLIRINKGGLPLFNDSPKDICPDIDEVKDFAISYLNNQENNLFGIRKFLSKEMKNSNSLPPNTEFNNFKIPKIVDLKNTGWVFIRPTKEWELIFKSGPSCPKHLPAHAHSDLLSFDLFRNGNPIISETGTSLYGNSLKRQFERSGAAHNVLRLAKSNHLSEEIPKWIEPVDIWSNFRAGRKAKTLTRSVKQINNSKFFISCSHNGFKSLKAYHKREITFLIYKDDFIELVINDNVECENKLFGNILFHFGPDQKKENFKIKTISSKLIKNIKYHWEDSYYSLSFGRTIERKSLKISFYLPIGSHILQSRIKIINSVS